MIAARVFLFLARPLAMASMLECMAFSVVGAILARAIGIESMLGGVGVSLGVVYVLGLLRLLDAAARRKG